MRCARWIIAAAALAVAAAGLYVASPHIETARPWYAVTGIDVSNHQGDIDWPQVAKSGVSFVFIKATEGGDFIDKRFAANWRAAKSAGLPTGAYHFFTQCKPGAEQARNFIATVPREAGSLPPVLDAEHMGPCKTPPATPLDPVTEMRAFLATAEAHFGCRPLIYTTMEFERAYLHQALQAEIYWVSSPYSPPLFKRGAWTFWQYHHNGRRPGIVGPIDLNAFRGTPEDFAAFRSSHRCLGPAG